MNSHSISIILMLFCIVMSGDIAAQSKPNNANSDALVYFLNLPKVIKSFSHQKPKDSSLIIIDRKNDFQPNTIASWATQPTLVIYDSSISQQLEKVYPFGLFKERCKFYIVMRFLRKGHSYTFTLLQPCSGLITNCTLVKKKGSFQLVNINGGVL